MAEASEIAAQEAECARLRKLAHDAPMNPYRVDANGHRWVALESRAWADTSNAWFAACDKLEEMKRRPMTGLLAQLTPEQREFALSYKGPVDHGDPAFLSKKNKSPQ